MISARHVPRKTRKLGRNDRTRGLKKQIQRVSERQLYCTQVSKPRFGVVCQTRYGARLHINSYFFFGFHLRAPRGTEPHVALIRTYIQEYSARLHPVN